MSLFATFSITARCPRTGMLGVAVATRVPAVGGTVPHLRAGVGAVATQAMANPYIGFHGIDLLARGASAEAVRDAIVAWDPDITRRQFAVVDAHGRAAAYTGTDTQPYAGHRVEDGFAVAGNLLAGPAVLERMADSFGEGSDDDLAERLLRAIEAGQAAGGDSRGKQSAALHVVDREAWSYIDLRVDEHAEPIVELRRVLGVWREVALPFLPSRPTRADLEARTGRTGPIVEARP